MTSGELPQITATGPVAAEALDWESMRSDLAHVVKVCDLLAAQSDSPTDEDVMIGRALWESAVISYGRCFTTGKGFQNIAPKRRRTQLNAVLDLLSPEQREVHERVKQERDTHIAHRVDDREAGTLAVVLAPPPGRAVLGTLFPRSRNIGGPTGASQLAAVARTLTALVVARRDDCLQRVGEKVEADLDAAYQHLNRGEGP